LRRILHPFRLRFQYEVSSDLQKSPINLAIQSLKIFSLPIFYTLEHRAVFPLNATNLVY